MKRILALVILSLVTATVAWSGSCPMWTKCPLDGAQANLVDTEYEGITAIGVYEHTTTTGQNHKFRMRCN
jgi:hypothetical protein